MNERTRKPLTAVVDRLFTWKWRLIYWWRKRRQGGQPTTGEVMMRTYIDALSAGHDSVTALTLARVVGEIIEKKPPPITEVSA